jgi:hypothetical protein
MFYIPDVTTVLADEALKKPCAYFLAGKVQILYKSNVICSIPFSL